MTEEGKRTCPYADRPILEALRLPSSVTAPHDLLFVIGLVLSQNAAIQIVFCSGAAPPSPRGKAFTSSNVLCTAKRFLITINLFARGRFPHHKTLPLHADISTPHRVAGATIGRPQIGRRRFPRKNGMTEIHCIMSGCVPTISIREYRRSRAKAFSRGEGGTLPVMAVILLY